MSIRVMTAVWDHSPYESGELLVLLALADWADEPGTLLAVRPGDRAEGSAQGAPGVQHPAEVPGR